MKMILSCWLPVLSSLICLGFCESNVMGGTTQTCFGSQCNQINFGKKKREIVSEIIGSIETKAEGNRVEEEVTLVEHEDVARRQKAEICVEPPCNQNRFGRKKRAIVEAMVGLANKEKREAQVQTCVIGLCSQNNFGRKKRAVIKAIVAVAQTITEDDLENELKQEVAVGVGNRNIFKSISAYLRGLFLLPDAQFNLRFLSGSSQPTTEDTPIQMLECSGPITSFCKNHLCRVKCIDGRKVEMKCDSNSLDIKNTAVGENTSTNQVSCGQSS